MGVPEMISTLDLYLEKFQNFSKAYALKLL